MHTRDTTFTKFPAAAFTLVLVTMLLTHAVRADDWPGFQGPDRDGTLADANIMTDWPDTGPPTLWTQDVATGFGGAAIVDDTVYLLDRNGIAGDRLRSIQLQTGKQNWAIDYDAPGRLSYDGARSTPTIHKTPAGLHAYTVGPLGHITCFDLTKQSIAWQKHMDDFDALPPKWGWSQSPLILGDLVIIQPMTPKAGLVALHQTTGQVAWQSGNIGNEGYASPRLVTLAGTPQLITFTSTQVTGLSPTTADILWTYNNIPVKRAIPTPATIGDNRLFITAGYDNGSALIEITQQNNTFAVKEIKRDREHGGQIHSPLPVNNHLYVNLNTNENLRQRGKHAQGLGCFDSDGNLLWKNNNQPDLDRGPVLAIGQHLLTLGGEDGTLRLLKANAKGYDEIAATKAFPADQRRNMIWAPMAYSDGLLLIRSQTQLKCIDLRP